MSNPNFIGLQTYSLDSKNRLAIPAKMRWALSGQKGMVLSQGLEGCLNLYPVEVWAKLNEKLETVSMKDKAAQRAFKRMLFASACDVEFDEEGRIRVPQNLVEYARLRKEVAIVGMGEKIEIWDHAVWTAYEKKQKSSFSRHASDLEI